MKTLCALLLLLLPLWVVSAEEAPANIQWRTIVRVVDGDTVELDGKEKVRLIGIDTPEKFESAKLDKDSERSGKDKKTIQALGEKASEYAKTLCEGKKVWLEYDQTRTDKYGRTLAYLHLEDGKVVNEEILKAGFANAYTKFPFKYMEQYRELEKAAREGKKGLWAE